MPQHVTQTSFKVGHPGHPGNQHGLKHGHRRFGLAPSRTYNSWNGMIRRCRDHERYNGRGIAVCSQWQGIDGFATFLEDMGERPEGLTLDRINNDGNYEPGNCRWATLLEQANNRRHQRVTARHCSTCRCEENDQNVS